MDELFQLTDTNFSVVLCVFVSRWWVRWMCVFSCFPCDVEAFSLTVGPVNKKMLFKINSTIYVMVDQILIGKLCLLLFVIGLPTYCILFSDWATVQGPLTPYSNTGKPGLQG